MIWHVFTVHNAEKGDIWPTFGIRGGQMFIGQKREHVLQKEDVW